MSTRSLEKVVSEDFELEKKINPSVKIQNGISLKKVLCCIFFLLKIQLL
jgi:hypothetical protein